MVTIKPITGFYKDFPYLVLITYFINTKNCNWPSYDPNLAETSIW